MKHPTKVHSPPFRLMTRMRRCTRKNLDGRGDHLWRRSETGAECQRCLREFPWWQIILWQLDAGMIDALDAEVQSDALDWSEEMDGEPPRIVADMIGWAQYLEDQAGRAPVAAQW